MSERIVCYQNNQFQTGFKAAESEERPACGTAGCGAYSGTDSSWLAAGQPGLLHGYRPERLLTKSQYPTAKRYHRL